jgi:hypothetical protein
MDNNLYNLLLRSFDAPLTESEQRRLENALTSSEEFRTAKEEIVALRLGLQGLKGEKFKPFFAERVMERLNTHPLSMAEYFVSVFRDVAIGAAVLVIICSAYNISRENTFTLDSALGIHHQTLEQILALETPFE